MSLCVSMRESYFCPRERTRRSIVDLLNVSLYFTLLYSALLYPRLYSASLYPIPVAAITCAGANYLVQIERRVGQCGCEGRHYLGGQNVHR